jgi:hypothetical protein
MNSKIVVQVASELEMLGFLKANGTQCRFVGLLTKTPVVKIKVGNPWNAGKNTESGLYKVSRKGGIINANYNTSVRRRVAEKLGVELKDVEYENGESKYVHLMTDDGKPLPVLVKKSNPNDGVYYLQYFPHKSKSVYVDEAGNVVPNATVEKWLYAESERPDFKPCVIAPKLANIKELRASGVIMDTPELDEIESLLAD